MNNHNHTPTCYHTRVKYCAHCNVTYCEDCGMEWVANYSWKIVDVPSFPSTPTWPTIISYTPDSPTKIIAGSHLSCGGLNA